jgi:hypothetical protein
MSKSAYKKYKKSYVRKPKYKKLGFQYTFAQRTDIIYKLGENKKFIKNLLKYLYGKSNFNLQLI